MKCKIKNCNNQVASESTGNYKKSHIFCEDHCKNGIVMKCKRCGSELNTRAFYYREDYICRSCILKERNNSEKMRKLASKRITKLNNDAEFKERRRKRMIEYNKEHKDELIKRGSILGTTVGRNNLLKFIGSEKQKEHLIKLNTSQDHKFLVTDSLNKRWKDKNQRKLMLSGFTNEHRRKLLNIFNNSFEEQETVIGVCRICRKEKEVTKDFLWCKDCKPCSGFDRDKFYNSKLEKIDFNYIDKNIKLRDIDELNDIPGVWAKFTENGICLDVSQTKDIGKEMLWSIRVFDSNANKTDEELKHDNQFRLRQKYRNMFSDCKGNIIFKIIALNIDSKEEREFIEMQYAYENKARYWNPAPNQNKVNKGGK